MIFSRNIIEQEFLTYQKLEINMPQIFKTKCILNFRKEGKCLIYQVSYFGNNQGGGLWKTVFRNSKQNPSNICEGILLNSFCIK